MRFVNSMQKVKRRRRLAPIFSALLLIDMIQNSPQSYLFSSSEDDIDSLK